MPRRQVTGGATRMACASQLLGSAWTGGPDGIGVLTWRPVVLTFAIDLRNTHGRQRESHSSAPTAEPPLGAALLY